MTEEENEIAKKLNLKGKYKGEGYGNELYSIEKSYIENETVYVRLSSYDESGNPNTIKLNIRLVRFNEKFTLQQ